MAHFAELDNDSKVTRVLVVANAVLDDNGEENEQQGIDLLKSLYGSDTTWKQCSYNNNFRNKYPAVGDTYDSARNAFITDQPFASWTLDGSGVWQPPVARPDDNVNAYRWLEDTQEWEQFTP